MATKQRNRILNITTPLGPDKLLIETLKATEGISQLFSIEATLLQEETPGGTKPSPVDPKSILGKQVNIQVALPDKTKRYFSGIVNHIAQGSREQRFSIYEVTIVPYAWVLTQRRQSRIFQQKSVPDILRKVFEGLDVKWEIQGAFQPRNYCVQYRETDFDFASRLMEEEGIYYFFVHTEKSHQMVVANSPGSHPDCSKSTVPFFHKVEGEAYQSAVWAFEVENAYQTGKFTFWDHNFQLPNKNLEAQKTTNYTIAENPKLEFYDFPGAYAKRFDGVDPGGGEQPAELDKIFVDNSRKAGIFQQMVDGRYQTHVGTSSAAVFVAGHKFELTKHPSDALNGTYVLARLEHVVQQSPSYISENFVSNAYSNHFACMPVKSPFRPLLKTEKPVMYGSQTATVVGIPGEEIFTDKFGRVKVQFHWDREGKYNAQSSCWLRVAQMWAGNQWGTMFIPRIGMEVLVDFLEGDPDQPIIVGCVYNPANMPPYKLPDEKTKSTLKSNSSKGGGGFNEFRFEDKKGKEQIFIHAERNEDIHVNNDCMEHIGHDRHLIVEKKQFEQVKVDKHLTVDGDHKEKIGGTMSLTVGSSLHEKVSQNYAHESGMTVHIKAGMTAVIEAGVQLTLKVGGNFIDINPAGVTIQGTMVLINSGGAAGSGPGSQPSSPTLPNKADDGKAGGKAPSPTPPPPPPDQKLAKLQDAAGREADSDETSSSSSDTAVALNNAATNGTPFV